MCVSRGDPRSAPLRGAREGGTRCQQRVGDAASPPDICAFGDGIVLPAAGRSISAPRGRIDAKVVQRMLILSIGTDRFECAVL